MSARRLAPLALALFALGNPVRGTPAEAPVIVAPAAGAPAFGALEVVVEPRGGTPQRVEFWFNGEKAGELTRPPWKLAIETGDDNRERRFRVVAVYGGDERREAEIVLPRIQVDDELDLPLRQLYVTASRSTGSDRSAGSDAVDHPATPVLDLPRRSFTVFDMGRRQQLVTFEHGDVPLTAVLLIDSSLSMHGGPLRAALAGARSFVSRMAALDEAMLLLFSDRIVHHTPWSADPEKLLSGLTGAEARGGSAVNDHLFLALQLLEKRQGRRVVILLSDGVDVESLLFAAQVHEIAVRSQALVYWIRVSSEPFDFLNRSAWRSVEEHSAEIRQLAATVDASGGRRIEIRRYEEASAAFQQILEELRRQYVLGFYPSRSRHDGAWHSVRIAVAAKDILLRTRDGYYDD